MVQEARQELEKLNQLLAADSLTPYRIGVATPDEFVAAPINAHFMPKKQYEQLVNNIKRDGNLSTLPFCWHDAEGKIQILSGHHRIAAAGDAGVKAVMYLYTDTSLTADQRTAIQLSHNAINGEDDLNILRQQWQSIATVEAKLYSGLDDAYFKTFEPVQLGAFSEKDVTYTAVDLLFLPAEIERIEAIFKRIKASQHVRYANAFSQYADFAATLMRLKEATEVYNSSTCMLVMIEAAGLYCDFLEKTGELSSVDWLALHEALQARDLANELKYTEHNAIEQDEQKKPKRTK